MNATRYRLQDRLKVENSPQSGLGVVVDTHSGVISSCNASATALLECLKSGASINELSDALASTFAITEEQAQRDAMDFFHRLSAMGLIDEVA